MEGSAEAPGADDGSGRPGGIRNEFSGVVAGSLVQAGYVGGDVIVHAAAAEPALPVPWQVPLLSSRFVNRVAEFAKVRDVLAPGIGGSVPITLVTGMPGVGKSAFVRRLAEQVRGAYPGGQLYVDFSGTQEQPPRAVGDVLTGFLVALGVAREVVPGSVGEQLALYRSLTAQQPTLVVLDKVTEPAQVRPFVPNAPGSAVLVTSTGRLVELLSDGAEPVPLEPLDDAGGAQLLIELGGARVATEPAAVAALVRQCGGLPVALQIAVTRLRARPKLRVDTLVAEIADEHRGLGAFSLGAESRVAEVFTVAYAALPADAARLYRTLGLLPSVTVTVDLAAAALGVEQAVAEELLDHLVQASLLDEDAEGQFRLHALVRRHALDRAVALDTEDDRVAVLRRAVEHVTLYAAFGDLAALGPGRLRCTPHEVLLAGRSDPFAHEDPLVREQRGLDWMDEARPIALGLLRVAVEHGWFDVAWQLAESMTALFVVRRYLVDWTEFSQLGARAARAAGNAAAEARLRSFASRPWTDLGDLSVARRELDTAFGLAEPLGQPRLLASIWELAGRYHEHVGEHADAVRAYERAVALFAEVDDRRGVAFVTYFLGEAWLGQGDPGRALDVLTRASDLVRAVGNKRMEGRILTAVGVALRRLGRDQEARAALAEAISLLAAGRYRYHEALAKEALAEVEESLGTLDAAVAALRQANAIYDELRSPWSARVRARLAVLSGDGSSPGNADGPDQPQR